MGISMDGRGRCMDNMFIERLWRSMKYEVVYLHEIAGGFKAERVMDEWTAFFNTERPHSALAGQTPAEAYGTRRTVDMMGKARTLSIISTGSTTETRYVKHGFGGMISSRNKP